jgi:outer membrane protein assembly factor BamA
MKRFLLLSVALVSSAASAQVGTGGLEKSALPAINFNSDEGFGYGIAAQVYHYGDGTVKPYRYTIQPLVFLTTKGRRDVSVFFDAPHLLPANWRISSYVGREQQLATPFYGVGNSTTHDETLEESPNPYYYRYGRTATRFSADLQHSLAGPLRVLLGTGVRSVTIDRTPFDSGTTLLAQQGGGTLPTGWVNFRTGLVYDTRDRETGPSSGQWLETLVQRAIETNGMLVDPTDRFTRITATARTYVSVSSRLVWAQRVVAQNVSGDAPFYELFPIQGSFKDSEGLGGSGTVRGLPMNRYSGKGVAFANEELRWRASEFRFAGRESALILSGFVDAGRVWERGLSMDGLFSDYHMGFGGGARLRYGPNFVVALDVAHSKESTLPIYIGLGYPF